MLSAGFIFPVDESEWDSPIIIQINKDTYYICVFVDYRILNFSYVHDTFLMHFNDELLYQVVGNEAYSFIDGFTGYHRV